MLTSSMRNIKTKPSRALLIAPMLSDIDMEACEVVHDSTVKCYILPIKVEDLARRVVKSNHFLGRTSSDRLYVMQLKTGQVYSVIDLGNDSLMILI